MGADLSLEEMAQLDVPAEVCNVSLYSSFLAYNTPIEVTVLYLKVNQSAEPQVRACMIV